MQRFLLASALLFTACTQSASTEADTPSGGGKADGDSVTETITSVEDADLPTLALAEEVQQLSGEEANGKLITVYTGGIAAPFSTYAIVFDPEPQDGGDYGSFHTFRVSSGLKEYPSSATLARHGDKLILTYEGTFADFDEEGNDTSVTRTITAKFEIGTDGALADSATVSY